MLTNKLVKSTTELNNSEGPFSADKMHRQKTQKCAGGRCQSWQSLHHSHFLHFHVLRWVYFLVIYFDLSYVRRTSCKDAAHYRLQKSSQMTNSVKSFICSVSCNKSSLIHPQYFLNYSLSQNMDKSIFFFLHTLCLPSAKKNKQL